MGDHVVVSLDEDESENGGENRAGDGDWNWLSPSPPPPPPLPLPRSVLTSSQIVVYTFVVLAGLVSITGVGAAHGGSLGSAARESLTVPTWLVLLTGGSAVGASFLLASFVTDRQFISAVHAWHRTSRVPVHRLLALIARAVGVLALVVILVVGAVGPSEALANLAILVVWVIWWAGFTMLTYLVGNAWPLVNPWRTIAGIAPSLNRSYPDAVGAWPSVAGLLALVWLEVVSPLADQPRLLVTVVGAYTVVTLAGAVVFGSSCWFGFVDPVARVFRYYGRVASVVWEEDSTALRWRLPGSALTESRLVDGRDEVAFVVALLWVTTYDGFVSTPAWRTFARGLVEAGLPALVLYPIVLIAGFVLFLFIYRLATRYSRQMANSFRSSEYLARRFAPSLLAIAAGYHLAHYLDYFLSLSPAVFAAVARPFTSPATVPVAQLPDWFGGLSMTFVLVGHLLAIWVAHATAYDIFPGRLQAIRSQYPITLVMIFYTMTSLWIVSQPTVQPPYV